MISEKQIRGSLTNVMDPEIHMNIIELNMVKDVKINESKVDVLIALTVAGCPLADTIKRDVRNELMKFEEVSEVNVETTVMTKEELDGLKSTVQKNRGTQQSQDQLISRLEKKKNENLIAIVSGKG